MVIKLNDDELSCCMTCNETAVISIKDQKFEVSYSTLMDFLTALAVVAAQIENTEINRNEDKLYDLEMCKFAQIH